MKALLIYKNLAVRWIEVREARPDYVESIRKEMPTVFSDQNHLEGFEHKTTHYQIYFVAVGRPTDEFIVYRQV